MTNLDEKLRLIKELQILGEKFRDVLNDSDEQDESDEDYCSFCNKNDEDDCDEEFDKTRLDNFHEDYSKIFHWSFGIDPNSASKENLIKRWAKRHPQLPKLFLPYQISNSVANIIILLQIIPHWHDSKKNEKL